MILKIKFGNKKRGNKKMSYGIYNSKIYRLSKSKEGKLYLFSWENDDGFIQVQKVYDYNGILHSGRFKKEINANDLEDAYKLDCKVIYKGSEFDISSSMSDIINTNKLIIGTLDYPLTEELGGFERVDKYYYEKEVSFDEIDKFLEVKKPLFHFKNTYNVTTKEIPKEEIMDYVKYIASFA
jgi:hypothetical protein